VEPRLLTEYAEAIERGQTVTIAGLSIGPTGISGSGFTVRWDEVADPQVADGRVQVFRKGATNPAFHANLGERNAALLPTLLAYLSR
jgi:hypothetical protein